jgi:cation diffusion facilitator family transporter
MNKRKVSVLGILVNVFLGAVKLSAGIFLNSAALIADGVHSSLDIISSFVAFLGIKIALKPEDEKHPYGYQVAETIGGLIVTFILAGASLWIVYEGITRLINREIMEFSFFALGIGIVALSIGVNEGMARLKFKYGRKEESLALVADAEHSRADALSSVGVLSALFLAKYFWQADGIITILVGLYILKESYNIGREAADNLMGIRDEKVEDEIKAVCLEKNLEMSSLQTSKIGAATSAVISLKLNPELRVEEAEAVSKNLQSELISRINNLKYAVIQIESHDIKEGFIRPRWGRRYGFKGSFEEEEKKTLSSLKGSLEGIPKKKGRRTVIPVKEGKLFEDFGSPEYLITDREGSLVLRKQIFKNPFYDPEKGGGMRILKLLEADEIITPKIGPGAVKRAEELGIKITIAPSGKKLEELM